MLALREAGYHNVCGVDVSPEAVAIAKGKGQNVVEADIRKFLSEVKDGFDLICAFDILEHFRKDEVLDLLELMCRSLKPRGVLLLQTPNAVSPWASHYRYGDLTHELIFSPECVASTLRLSGFKDIEVREVAPFAHGLKSAVRWCIWKLIRGGCSIWSIAETGGLCGGVYSRNMMVKGVKDETAS
jgi:SAM-dependent methyltransferase